MSVMFQDPRYRFAETIVDAMIGRIHRYCEEHDWPEAELATIIEQDIRLLASEVIKRSTLGPETPVQLTEIKEHILSVGDHLRLADNLALTLDAALKGQYYSSRADVERSLSEYLTARGQPHERT